MTEMEKFAADLRAEGVAFVTEDRQQRTVTWRVPYCPLAEGGKVYAIICKRRFPETPEPSP